MTTKQKSNRNIVRGEYHRESERSQAAKATERMARINKLMLGNVRPQHADDGSSAK